MKRSGMLIVILALAALIYYCVSYATSPVKTMSLYSVIHEEVAEANAYIVRDETVYYAPASGTFYGSSTEGARVGKNRRIATVYSADVSEEILGEINNIDNKIEALTSVVVDGSEFKAGGVSVEEKLAQLKEYIEEAAYSNDVAKIREYKNEINVLLSGGGMEENADELSKLIQQKKQIERSIAGMKQDIYSDEAGVYSANVDGYEEVLTPGMLENINCLAFSKIKSEVAKDESDDGKKDKNDEKEASLRVNSGDSVCKIINNHRWFIAALVNKADVEDLKVGQRVSIRFSDLAGEETTATVKSVSNEAPEQKKAVAVFECESYCEGAFSVRVCEIEIIKKSYSGFSVPINAIHANGNGNGIMVRQGGNEILKPCKILYRDEEKGEAIVVADTDDVNRMLDLYDLVVVGEK